MPSLFEAYGLIEPEAVPAKREPEPRGFTGVAKDVGISALKGAIGVPEAAVGALDLVTGGRAGQAAEAVGFRPGEAKAMLDDAYSEQQKEAFRRVQAADGFGETLMEAVRNPSVVAHSVVESLPLMGAGGVVARGGMALAPRLGPMAAAAMGEGVVGAGSAAESIRQQTPDGTLDAKQTLMAAGTGVLTTGFAALGGKIAKSLGIADVDTMIAGVANNPVAAKSLTRRVLEGAVSEGVLEELPQSVSEQVLQNAALGKPLDEGVNQAAVLGLLSGGAMGGGVNVVGGHAPVPTPIAEPKGPLSRAANAAAQQPAATVGMEAPAAAAPQEPAVDPVVERINKLQGTDRGEALAAYDILNRDDAPKGVRQYNSRLLDELLAKLEPKEEGAAPVESSDPAALLTSTMGRDPVQGALEEQRNRMTALQNLDNWMARAQPLALDHAQDLQAAAAERGLAMEVVPHAQGQGFTVVPAEWITPEMRGQVATALPLDTAPTGVLRADATGNVAPETGAQAIDARNVAAAQSAERQRKNELGLTPDVEAVQAGVKHAPKPEPLPTDVKNKKGEPFKNKGAALRAQKAAGGGDVIEVQGGWVVRTAAAAPAVQQELEGTNVGDDDAAVALAAGDGGQRGDDAGTGERAPTVAGGDAGGAVVHAAAAPAAGGAEGQPVRDAAGESATAVAEGPAAAAVKKPAKNIPKNIPPRGATAAGGERWTEADAAARERLLLTAGWNTGSPGLEKMKAQAWDKMTQGQRNRITKAIGTAPAPKQETIDAQEPGRAGGDGGEQSAAPAAVPPVRQPGDAGAGAPAAAPVVAAAPAADAAADDTGTVPDGGVAETKKFYVTMVRDGRKVARLAGPFDTKEQAEQQVEPARKLASELDAFSDFDAFGVTAFTAAEHKPGTLNDRLQGASAPHEAKPSAAKPSTIQDAGEKIGGARKDRWKERGLAVSDLDEMSDTEGAELAVKQNVWKPDYEAMVEAGATAKSAASVKIIYDRLAAKPKADTPAGRRQYVQMMQHVRDVFGAVKTEADFKAAKEELLYGKLKWALGSSGSNERARANAQGVENLDAHMKQAKALLFSVYKGRTDPFYFDFQDDRKAGSMVSDGFPAKGEPWKRRLAVRVYNGNNITPAGLKIYGESSAAVGTPLTDEQLGGTFYMVRAVADGKTVGFFATKVDAEAGAKAIYERDLMVKKDEKPEPERPHLDEVKRTGLPQRIDRDVSAQDFIAHFGFRGIEFGNWSAQDERQRILNMAYDGLADLAEIMGVPPKAMSLNGTMGMAFGARGGGRFAAHYEPGKLVINMTKLRGGGSLAHEWAHALDHYFGELNQPDAYKGKARGASGWYDEGQYNGVPITRHERQADGTVKRVDRMRLANLRPELAAALDGVMSALFQAQITKTEMLRELEAALAQTEAMAAKETDPQLKKVYGNSVANQRQNIEELKKEPDDKTFARGKSEYAKEAQKLSGKSANGYWLRPTEMFARAFESWVFDRVVAMGARSDYLVHGVEETRFAGGGYKGNPYPVGKERAAIDASFDALAKTIQTKETDKGVVMFRRADGSAVGNDLNARAAAVQHFVDGIKKNWANAPEIIVVPNMQDARVPEFARETDEAQRDQGSEGDVHGFHYQGKVYLVASALADANTALTTLAHEALGHYGLQGFFGEALKPIKQQIVAMRRKEVLAKAEAYGMPVTPEAVRAELGKGATNADVQKVINLRLMYAAEEVLAEMAQTTPQLGFVQRAIAAIKTWLREHVAAFKDMALSDEEIIRSFILPARDWVVRGEGTGARRQAAAAAPVTQFSRGEAGNTLATTRPLRAQIMEAMNDTFTAPGKLNWWHKTIGTQYNLAQRSPQFKRVFDGVQDFLNDVSLYATEAADLAPKILPKLETWRDIGKAPISAEDNKAVSAPVFEGTLLWARDERGQPVKVEELRKQADGLTAEAKAQRMLRAGAISENVLKMWKGLPLDQYEAAVATRFDNQMLRAGVVWSDDELRSQFKLSDAQIALYKEFRASVDRSLTHLAVSDMVRFGGKDVEAVRQDALDAGDVDAAALILRDHLLELADKQPDRNELLIDTAERMIDKADRARDLMDRGYAPLSRFGHYTVDAIDENGERVFFGMFETAREAALAARKMKGNFPKAQITRGTVSEEEYKLFAGVSPETVELFGELLGLESQGNDAASKAFQTYVKVAKANRSAMKRLIERKGIAGFSEDVGRVLAGFVYSNARQTSQNLHMGEMTDAAAAVSKGEGELKDAATRLVDYIKNPQEEAQGFRGLLFAQYLGGSVASAIVNMLQPVQVTFPYLSQFGGAGKAAARMKQAFADVKKKTTGDAALDAALKKAEEEGIVAPQEVHQLMAQARGRGVLKSGDGTVVGDARAHASNALSRLALAWGKVFGAAEQFNRRVTFIAAYRTAAEQGIADPAAFAEKAIAETQFVYNKGNKPQWARGAIGSTLFTFKQYSISYVELLHRMATQGGPEGKKAALLALGMLFLFSGAGGLPFAEDAEDLVDGVMQRLGYNFSTKLAKKQFFEKMLGKELGRFAEHGVSGLPGVPIDVSGRLGLGNLIPGTGLLVDKEDHTRDATEFLGAGGDFATRLFKGVNQLAQGNVGEAGKLVAPRASANAVKALEMYSTGQYKDDKGRKVIDVDGFEATMKALGFQPTDVARVQEATGLQQQMIAGNKQAESRFAERWAKAVAESDQDALAKVREDIRSWNEKNPDTRIQINRSQIAKRVQALREDKATRIERTAPKEIRSTVRRELEAS